MVTRCWPVDTNLLQLSQSSVIITAALLSLSHQIRTSSIHLHVGRPGCLSLSTTPDTSVFNSRSSDILQMWPTDKAFSFERCQSSFDLVVPDFSLHRYITTTVCLTWIFMNDSHSREGELPQNRASLHLQRDSYIYNK